MWRQMQVMFGVMVLAVITPCLAEMVLPEDDDHSDHLSLIVVYLDGFSPDMLNYHLNFTPNIGRIMDEGVFSKMQSVWPANRENNKRSILTGLYPVYTGVDRSSQTTDSDRILEKYVKDARMTMHSFHWSSDSGIQDEKDCQRDSEDVLRLITGNSRQFVEFVTNEPGETAQEFGLNSKQVGLTLKKLDKLIGILLDAVDTLNREGKDADLIVISNHGIAPITKCVPLDRYITDIKDKVELNGAIPSLSVKDKTQGAVGQIFKSLQGKIDGVRVFDLSSIPSRLHLQNNNFGDVIFDPDPNIMVALDDVACNNKKMAGYGFDNSLDIMQGFLAAKGIGFQINYRSKSTRSILEIYNLLASALNFKYEPNNATKGALDDLLKTPNRLSQEVPPENTFTCRKTTDVRAILPFGAPHTSTPDTASAWNIKEISKHEDTFWCDSEKFVLDENEITEALRFTHDYYRVQNLAIHSKLTQLAIDWSAWYGDVNLVWGPVRRQRKTGTHGTKSHITHFFYVITHCRKCGSDNCRLISCPLDDLVILPFIVPVVESLAERMKVSSFIQSHHARLKDVEYVTGLQFFWALGVWSRTSLLGQASSRHLREFDLGEAPTFADHCKLPLVPARDPNVADNSWRINSFPLNSRLEYSEIPSSKMNSYTYSIQFRPSNFQGVIYYAADANHNHFVALVMDRGSLIFSFNCGNGIVKLKSNKTYDIEKWHTIVFSLNDQNSLLSIDSKDITKNTSICNPKLVGAEPPFFLGGISKDVQQNNKAKENLQKITTSVTGCLREVMLNDDSLGEEYTSVSATPCSDKVEPGIFFSGDNAYISSDNWYRNGMDFHIQMKIRPRSISGILLSVNDNANFLILQIVNGAVKFSFEPYGKEISLEIPMTSYALCDSQWHVIQVVNEDNKLILSVDNKSVEEKYETGTSNTKADGKIYFGGHLDPTNVRGALTTTQFVGCTSGEIIKLPKLEKKASDAIHFVGNVVLYCPTI